MGKRKKKKRSTAESAARRAKDHKSGFSRTHLEVPDGVNFIKIKDDKARRFDIIPYEIGKRKFHKDITFADKGSLHPERTYFKHRRIGAEQNDYICNSKTFGKKCPICDFRNKLKKDEDADDKLIADLAPKEHQLFNVIDIKDRDKGVQILDYSYWLFGKKLDARIDNRDDDDGYENYAELEDGLTLKIGWEEKHFAGNKYYECESIDFKNRKEDYDEDILEDVYDLDAMIKVLDYDKLKAILLQTEDDEEDPKVKKKKSKKEKAEDDDEDEDEEDEEDELPPKKKKKSKKKKGKK